jgi:hypothetical protein
MTLRSYTAEEKIEELERAIGALRRGKMPGAAAVEVLKEIAKDLRARQPGAAGAALLALQRRIADAAATRTGVNGVGFDPNALLGIGQEIIGRWATVRQALERFEEEA